MRTGSPNEANNKLVVEDLQEWIAENEKWLKSRTGKISQRKLDNQCKGSKSNQIFPKADFDVFEKIWPHRDSLTNYRQPSEYIHEEDWKYDGDDDSDYYYRDAEDQNDRFDGQKAREIGSKEQELKAEGRESTVG